MGLWLQQVLWLVRLNLIRLYTCLRPPSLTMTTLSASTRSTYPDSFAVTRTPESTAALYSIPVPTIGESVTISGTACFCIFEPMSARVLSSFSRNGIIAVATETTILGDTSIRSTVEESTSTISFLSRTITRLFLKCPSSSSGSFACAIM